MASEHRPMVLVPYDRREAMSLREAARLAGRCESTVRAWCGMYDIGLRVGNGPWQVSRVALGMFLDGAADALRAYLAGDRTGELVEVRPRGLGGMCARIRLGAGIGPGFFAFWAAQRAGGESGRRRF